MTFCLIAPKLQRRHYFYRFSQADVEAYELFRYNPKDLQPYTWKYVYQHRKKDEAQSNEDHNEYGSIPEINAKLIHGRTPPSRQGEEVFNGGKRVSSHNTIMTEFKHMPTSAGMKVFYGRPLPGHIIILPNVNNVFDYHGKPV
ncbi:uncharacterized protein LOC124643014 [Helicoverpa zea]|uniref:uncharacterized protein LOC124643014 n=1 Tax=Helicoverpa zea TaxID=7113 RepID=UPI001F57A40E|nr:uncharacterized protein LOC124643014 [Helicoverpa zea]